MLTGFKIPTHVASANRTLDQLALEVHINSGGSDTLSFEVDGQTFSFPVSSKEAYIAVLRQQDFFRAGVIGPDGFSELLSGQLFQHGNESSIAQAIAEAASGGAVQPDSFLDPLVRAEWDSSDPATRKRVKSDLALPTHLEDRTRPSQYRSIDYAMHMLAFLESGGYSGVEREQILAFIMGYIAHGVGDAFSHHWVNQLTGEAWDLKGGRGIFGWQTEEFQHMVVEAWVDDKVPGALENADGSEEGQFDRYSIRAPQRFLTEFFAARSPGLAEYGDRDSASPEDFFAYYRNTDQFRGGPTYNYFNVQDDVARAAENWAHMRDIFELGQNLSSPPQTLEAFLTIWEFPERLQNQLSDWTEGELLETLTGANCDFMPDSTEWESFLKLWRTLATFQDRIDAYRAKAQVARANWIVLSECTAQNLARADGPAYDPAQPHANRDACTVLAEKAEAGVWADNASDGHGLVRGNVTDAAWLDKLVAHFKGEYTSGVHVLADAIGDEVEEQYGDANPELAMLREYLSPDPVSDAYEPVNKHRSALQNIARQEEYLWGPGFLMDDFREALSGSEFGGTFQRACEKVRDPAALACVNTAIRAAAIAKDVLECPARYDQCVKAGLLQCGHALCEISCNAHTLGFADGVCEYACGLAEEPCEAVVSASCPQVQVPGCQIPFDGKGCLTWVLPALGVCPGTPCFATEWDPLECNEAADSMCDFDRSFEECVDYMAVGCERKLALECAPGAIGSIVDEILHDEQYAQRIVEPFANFCTLVEQPLEELAEFAIDRKDAIYDFMNANRLLLGQASSSLLLTRYMEEQWHGVSQDARINAAFINGDVAGDPSYRATMRQRAETTRLSLLPQAADPAVAEQIAGLTEFISAIDSGKPFVVQVNTDDPAASFQDALAVVDENARELAKMKALLTTGIFEGIDGPTVARMKADLGGDLQESFDPFFNTVHGMKLVPLSSQADIEGVFVEAGVTAARTPWLVAQVPTSRGGDAEYDLYSEVCRDPETTNLYCDVLTSNDDPSCLNCAPVHPIGPEGWMLDRGLIAFNHYDPTGQQPDHVKTFFPFASSDEAYERIYKRIFRTPRRLPDSFGFEGPEGLSAWVVDQGSATLSLDSTTKSRGGSSLAVQGCGYIGVSTVPFNTAELGVLSRELSVDVYVPPAPAGQEVFWYGALGLHVSVPAAGVNQHFVGHHELTPLAKGSFSTLTFTLPEAVYAALAGENPGVVVSFKLNTPCVSGMDVYRLDNLRFSGDVEDRTAFHQIGSRHLPVRSNWLFSFEDVADWSVSPSSGLALSAETSRKEDGQQSLRVEGGGWIPITSRSFSASSELGSSVGAYLNVDLYVPGPLHGNDWVGDVRVQVSCPGSNIYSRQLGDVVELRNSFEDEFNSFVFAVPSDVQGALRGSDECTITPVLNVPGGIYYLDKMGFLDSPG